MINGNHFYGVDRQPTAIVSTVASDSHTWNLVFLQLLLEEHGYSVANLGACVPDDLLLKECRELRPDVVVISSVNGHGHQDGRRVIRQLRDCPELAETPIVIGGKLGIAGGEGVTYDDDLRDAGFTEVFEDGAPSRVTFDQFLRSLPDRAGVAV
ncbi:cobalamin-dependent protein [Micromonospora sp. NPDC006766]|uniref:cobalamin B12-binding domain-containing protein n=1 Tax=Micromonospora sp. NPDC006766 TaxID=3154778 RepID=UPI003401584F